ncbi:MAG: AzlC family ABC transporter permease [Sphaerochaetaceae bacterium]|jgi:4-azaleucine resistance transporter AzlC|nr:AzlC family ABC transporter permease [Sphaerochaetaceae bacterium]MDD4218886.1 AzlC family ABC transporter permease [Sphaerochaetaceae bacterium]MDY0372351.1 AzlC family ABC transporter permease [Sphaerochaetaceae bacterium]
MSSRAIIKQALLRTIPVMMGYLVLGIAFGLLLQKAGYHWVWALGISLFVFAGSMQFVLVGLLVQQAPLTTVAVTTLLVNSRHLFYGLSFIERFKKMGKRGLYMIFALTDETYALLCAAGEVGSTEDRDNLAWWMALLNQSYWVIGSTLGALLGSYITFNITGIEFAMTALFTVIVVEQWLNSKNHLPSIVGFVCATIALIWLGPAQFLLPALIVTVLMLLIMRNVVEPSR